MCLGILQEVMASRPKHELVSTVSHQGPYYLPVQQPGCGYLMPTLACMQHPISSDVCHYAILGIFLGPR